MVALTEISDEMLRDLATTEQITHGQYVAEVARRAAARKAGEA